MARLDLYDKDPSELSRDELLYLQDRDRLPEGYEPISMEDRMKGKEPIRVAHATGTVLISPDQVKEFTGHDSLDDDDMTVVGGEDVEEVDSYDELTVEELKAELKDRKLSTSGNKDELVARLEADDAKGE